jgi:DNA-binding XRE family transcriptional regulator
MAHIFINSIEINVAQRLSTRMLWQDMHYWAKLMPMSQQTIEQLREDLAANLKALRAAQSYAQDSLALESGVHRTMLSKIERCLTNPSLETLVKLANTLNVSVSELLQQR